MRQITNQQLTGRFAVVKVFPYIHALKVEIRETYIDENKEISVDHSWRLATDKDILDLQIPVSKCYTSERFKNISVKP